MKSQFLVWVDKNGDVQSRVAGSLVDQNNNAFKVATYLQNRAQFSTKIADKFTGNLKFNQNPGEPIGLTD